MIDEETTALQKKIDAPDRSLAAADQASQLRSAEPLSGDLKRQIGETLVEFIIAEIVKRWGVPQSSHRDLPVGPTQRSRSRHIAAYRLDSR